MADARLYIPGTTGGSGSGLVLGPPQNKFTGASESAAETARDDYATANAAWLAQYDATPTFLIEVTYGSTTTYQARRGSAWVDVTPIVRGPEGGDGTDGTDGTDAPPPIYQRWIFTTAETKPEDPAQPNTIAAAGDTPGLPTAYTFDPSSLSTRPIWASLQTVLSGETSVTYTPLTRWDGLDGDGALYVSAVDLSVEDGQLNIELEHSDATSITAQVRIGAVAEWTAGQTWSEGDLARHSTSDTIYVALNDIADTDASSSSNPVQNSDWGPVSLFRGAWSRGIHVKAGQIITDSGGFFIAVQDVASSNTAPGSDTTNYIELGGGGTAVEANPSGAVDGGALTKVDIDGTIYSIADAGTVETETFKFEELGRVTHTFISGNADKWYDTGIDLPATVAEGESWAVRLLGTSSHGQNYRVFPASEISEAANSVIDAGFDPDSTSTAGHGRGVILSFEYLSGVHTLALGKDSDGNILVAVDSVALVLGPLVLYKVTGGGTKVGANPSGTPSGPITAIDIDGVVYSIATASSDRPTDLAGLPIPTWTSGTSYSANTLVVDAHGRVFRVSADITTSNTAPAQDATHFSVIDGYEGDYAGSTAYPRGALVTHSGNVFFVLTAVPASNTDDPAVNSAFVQIDATGGGSTDGGGGPFATEIGSGNPGTVIASRVQDTNIDIPDTVGANEWWGIQLRGTSGEALKIFKASQLTGLTNVTIGDGINANTSPNLLKFISIEVSADQPIGFGRTSDGDIVVAYPSANVTPNPIVLWRINTAGGGSGGGDTDLSLGTRSADSLVIESSSGDNVTVPASSSTQAGLETAEHNALTTDIAVDHLVFWAGTTLHEDFDDTPFGDTLEFVYGTSRATATVRSITRREHVATLIITPLPAATWTAIDAESTVVINNSEGNQIGGWTNASEQSDIDDVVVTGQWYRSLRVSGAGYEAWRALAEIDEEDNTHLAVGTRNATSLEITSTTGEDVTLPVASESLAGLESAADKTHLDSLPTAWTAGVWAIGAQCAYGNKIYRCNAAKTGTDTDTPAADADWIEVTGKQADWNEATTTDPAFILNKPTLAPSNAEQNVQVDWNETTTTSDAYIQNKPTLAPSDAEANVQADWNETTTTADAYIQNKPTLAPSNAEQNVQVDWDETTTTSDAYILNKPDSDQSVTGAALTGDIITLSRRGDTNPITINLDGTAVPGSISKAEKIGITADVTVAATSWAKIESWAAAPESVYPASLAAEIITRDDAHTLTLAAGIYMVQFRGETEFPTDRAAPVFKIQENDGTTVYTLSDKDYDRNTPDSAGVTGDTLQFSLMGVYIASDAQEVEIYAGSEPDLAAISANNASGQGYTLKDGFEFTIIRMGSGNAQINNVFNPEDIGTDTFDLDGNAQEVALTDDTSGSAIVIPETGYILTIATVPGVGLRGQISMHLAEDLRAQEMETGVNPAFYTNTDNELLLSLGSQDEATTGNKVIVQRIGSSAETSSGADSDVQPSILRFDVTGHRSVSAGDISGARTYTAEISQSGHIGTARIVGFTGTATNPQSVTTLRTNAQITSDGGYHHASGTITIPSITLAADESYTIRLEVYPTGVPDTEAPTIYHDYRITAHAAAASVHFGSMPFYQSGGTTETTDADLADFSGDIRTAAGVAGTWTIADLTQEGGERRLYWAVPASGVTLPRNWVNSGVNVNDIIVFPDNLPDGVSTDTQTIGGVAYFVYTTNTRFDDFANGTSYTVSTS